MPRLDRVSEPDRKGLIDFPCLEYETVSWTAMTKDLSECRVALVTTAGLHLRGDQPFFARDKYQGDQSFRVIPGDSDPRNIVRSHFSIGFDPTGFYRDINVVFPIDRLRELHARGAIGSLTENYYSFMGAVLNPHRMVHETGPEVAERLKSEGADVVLMTPI